MANQQSGLYVEGKDDSHALLHMLATRGLPTDASWFPRIKKTNGVEGLLAGMETAIRFATGHSVGFVLDANASANDRWRAVTSRLVSVGLTPPAAPPTAGYIDFCQSYQTRTGVWMMPDNRREGALEDFLIDLIDPTSPLLAHARGATAHAKALGAGFTINATRKAELRAWLAWCEEPGLPYGTAIKAGYFHHDSPDSEAFVTWFTKLFHTAGTEGTGQSWSLTAI